MPPVSLTSVANGKKFFNQKRYCFHCLPPGSTLVANLPLVSTKPAELVAHFAAGVVDTVSPTPVHNYAGACNLIATLLILYVETVLCSKGKTL